MHACLHICMYIFDTVVIKQNKTGTTINNTNRAYIDRRATKSQASDLTRKRAVGRQALPLPRCTELSLNGSGVGPYTMAQIIVQVPTVI